MLRFLILVVLLLFSCTVMTPALAALPIHTTTVYRGVQFDRLRSAKKMREYGSREALLRGSIDIWMAATLPAHYKQKTILVTSERHMSRSAFIKLVEAPVKGFIFEISGNDTFNEDVLKIALSKMRVKVPVYFLDVAATHRLLDVIKSLSPRQSALISVGRNLNEVAPYVNHTIPWVSIEGSIARRNESKLFHAPKVMISTHFDTLGVIPISRTTAGSSGVAAAMELWRRFLFSAARQGNKSGIPKINVHMGSQARTNYGGTMNWVSDLKRFDIEHRPLIVCLDELYPLHNNDEGDDDDDRLHYSDGTRIGEAANKNRSRTLYMHMVDSIFRRPDGKALMEEATSMAAAHGIVLKVISSKTNFQHYDFGFEHEIPSNQGFLSLTFSSRSSHKVDQLVRESRWLLKDADTLEFTKRVHFIYSFICKFSGCENMDLQWPGSASYMEGILRFASSSVRSPLAKEGSSQRNFADSLTANLKKQISLVQSAEVWASAAMKEGSIAIESPKLYGPYEETLSVFVAEPYILDIVIAILVVLVLAAFSLTEFGWEKTKDILLFK